MTAGRHVRLGGRGGLQAEVARLTALASRLRGEATQRDQELAEQRVSTADAIGRTAALRDEVAALRHRLDDATAAVVAHEAETERMRGELVLARGTARQAERSAAAEAAELRAQVADLQRRLDDASALVDSVTRAVATRVAGAAAEPTGAGSPAGPPAMTHPAPPPPATPSTGPGGPLAAAGASVDRPDGAEGRAQVAWRVPLVAPAAPGGAPASVGEARAAETGPQRPDPDAGVTIEVDPRLDPWGRPFPATGSS